LSPEKILLVLFYGQRCEAAQAPQKHGKERGFKISFAISPGDIMPAHTLAAKSFEICVARFISALPRPGWLNFSGIIAS
jgi:hypothetical protein